MSADTNDSDSTVETNTPSMQPNGTWLQEHEGETVEIDLPNRPTFTVTVTRTSE